MSELKMISPLLDRMSVEKEGIEHNGRACFTLCNTSTGERFVLKRISVPASDSQVRALILSGAYADEAAVHAYYGRVVKDIQNELEAGKAMAASGNFAGAVSYQIEKKESGVGFDVYILYPLYVPLTDILAENAMTHLHAVNMGIDLCDALQTCREAGYLFGNLKPENVFLMPSGRFLLGDLGLVPLLDLQYACLPEDYIGAFAAPELSDIMASPNTTIDLYALGMLLYRVYNGNHGPFEDENTGEAMADKLRMSGKSLPTPMYADYELTGIILKACAFKQQDRFQTPDELKQALMLYMQRNELSDALIVPPIVAEPVTISDEPEEETEEPIRMTDAENLDEDFRRSFAPDLSGAGTEADIDPTVKMPTPELTNEHLSEQEPEEEPAQTAEETAEIIQQSSEQEEQTAPGEEPDSDQMDFDMLLASINQYVGAENEQPAPETKEKSLPENDLEHDYIDEIAEAPEADVKLEAEPRTKLAKVLAIVALLLAIFGVCYYLVSWYYVDVDKLNLVECTPEQVVIELDTADAQERFVLTCTDSYGSARPVSVKGNIYTFTGLEENNTYKIMVEAAEHHKLTSASSVELQVTTPERTKITEFDAARGSADGEVQLTITQEGPTPERWELSYTDESGKELGSTAFSGNTCKITGLQLNKTYRFRLENTGDVWMTGVTETSYTLLPIVEAKNLHAASIDGKQVTIAWECGPNVPDTWTVTCEAEGMETMTDTTSDTSFTMSLPDFDRDYLISVQAAGMDDPEQFELPANPIIVENLTATANADGTVTVTWDAPAGSPSDGWMLSYNTVGSLHDPRYYPGSNGDPITDTTVTMTDLIPNTAYEIRIEQTTQTIYGAKATAVKTAETVPFDEYNVTPEPVIRTTSGYISLWLLPTRETWDYTHLKSLRTYFNTQEKIAVCIQVNGVNASDDEVTLLYAIRDANGNVVNDVPPTKLAWNDLWYSRHHASEIPLPARAGEDSIAGNYTLEIYVNGKLLALAGFEIIEVS